MIVIVNDESWFVASSAFASVGRSEKRMIVKMACRTLLEVLAETEWVSHAELLRKMCAESAPVRFAPFVAVLRFVKSRWRQTKCLRVSRTADYPQWSTIQDIGFYLQIIGS